MVLSKTVDLLEALVSGRLGIGEFEQQLSDRLLELRQDPTLTDEKRALSRIQLYLHEFCFRNNSALLPNQEAVFAALIRGVMYDKAKPYHALVASNSQGGFNE